MTFDQYQEVDNTIIIFKNDFIGNMIVMTSRQKGNVN